MNTHLTVGSCFFYHTVSNLTQAVPLNDRPKQYLPVDPRPKKEANVAIYLLTPIPSVIN